MTNPIEEKIKEFDEKSKLSYAKGGFLTTDLHLGSWEIDIYAVRKWLIPALTEVRASVLSEIEEKVNETEAKYWRTDKRTKEQNYMGTGQCRQCNKRRDSLELEEIKSLLEDMKK